MIGQVMGWAVDVAIGLSAIVLAVSLIATIIAAIWLVAFIIWEEFL